MTRTIRRHAAVPATLALASLLCACASTVDKIEQIGQPPALHPIAVPQGVVSGAPVSLPQPAPDYQAPQANSLWQTGSRSFFRDPRAAKVGDLLTVQIAIGDQAKIANTTSRSTKAAEDSSAPNLLGLESRLKGVLPKSVDPSKLITLGSDSSNTGTGSVDRSENINLTVAAVVTQVLPNGNLVIQGQQEVRVNNEVRELSVSGVVRPEDISNANTISHTQIAEARISYGGRGQITDVQQPRYGQQFFDIVWPF
ncbi:MAG TPA: flagellar basal body L-ring protein FlgH [Micropepsaceae bacterium]|jgi:flagellar L-ring protein precursor FlgH|nr:flagellar basal body L-ring protein FlgH [Micropepsaceae bacterium]